MNILETSFIKISNLIRNSNNLKLGSVNSSENSSGDLVKELDIISHNIIIEEIHKMPDIKGYISEESDDITITSQDGNIKLGWHSTMVIAIEKVGVSMKMYQKNLI